MEENGLRPEFEKYGIGDKDFVFIKEVIAGPLSGYKEQESTTPSNLPIVSSGMSCGLICSCGFIT